MFFMCAGCFHLVFCCLVCGLVVVGFSGLVWVFLLLGGWGGVCVWFVWVLVCFLVVWGLFFVCFFLLC